MTGTATTQRVHTHPAWRRVLATRETAIIALVIVVIAAASLWVPFFAQPLTMFNLLRDTMTALMIALPMTLIMITGDIDISVG
ncbi:MAG: ABC transporter permease, partial [Propionibacteriaceae bacterium]|nr:ABC transporter permease [Propionibacteriaceae bacterium]